MNLFLEWKTTTDRLKYHCKNLRTLFFFLFVLLSQVNLFGKKRSAWEETCLQFSGMAAANSTMTKSGKTAKNMMTLTVVN